MSQNFVRSAARFFIEKQYGGPTTEQESNIVVPPGNVLIRAVANNAERVSLTFVNAGTGDFFIGFGNQITLSSLRLQAQGGTINMELRDDATLVTREWFVQGPTTGNLYVLEVIRSIYTPDAELPGVVAQ